MKAIHGGKSKNDKIATMLRAGMLPMAYVYPRKMRAARDLLRRREYFMHQESELLTHVKNTNTQYNYPAFIKRIAAASNRTGLAERFDELCAQKSIEADLHLLDVYHRVLLDLESEIKRQAKHHDPVSYHLLQTISGVGPILALVILYEVHDINRFPKVGNFISYARLVKCAHESAGKRSGSGNNKIGNAHLKWAFSEVAVLFLRDQKDAKRLHQKLISKYGKAKALSIIAQRLGRTTYTMLKRRTVFDHEAFFASLN